MSTKDKQVKSNQAASYPPRNPQNNPYQMHPQMYPPAMNMNQARNVSPGMQKMSQPPPGYQMYQNQPMNQYIPQKGMENGPNRMGNNQYIPGPHASHQMPPVNQYYNPNMMRGYPPMRNN